MTDQENKKWPVVAFNFSIECNYKPVFKGELFFYFLINGNTKDGKNCHQCQKNEE
jgi:hypothetical protein